MRLSVILRTCDSNEIHPERGPRYINVEKSLLVKKCVKSLINSIKQSKSVEEINLKILDDNSSVETLEYLIDISKGLDVTLLSCSEKGYNYSALKQFELCAAEKSGLVYCVEDDYLHFPNAIEQMFKMYMRFEELTGSVVAIRPDDDIFNYSSNNRHSRDYSLIFLGEDRYWRTSYSSHATLLTHASVFHNYWELFASLGKFYKKLSIDEDRSINMIWEKVPLFSPMPGLAMHVSQNNEPPFVDYKALWNGL